MTEPLGGYAAGDDLFRDGLFPGGDSFGDGPVGGQQQEYSSIESIIRAAGDHIEPTDDLRPRTLEAARRRCRQQRIGRRAGGLAVAALLLAMSFPARIDHSRHFESAYDVHRQVVLQATGGSACASWGLVDVFTEWRRRQAELFSAESGWHGQLARP
jgi:hypothetical protein